MWILRCRQPSVTVALAYVRAPHNDTPNRASVTSSAIEKIGRDGEINGDGVSPQIDLVYGTLFVELSTFMISLILPNSNVP